MSDSQVIVLGGGAAGLSAAIAAARRGACVTVLEAKSRVGSSILVTGNGRCNLSHTPIAAGDYNKPSFVGPILDAHSPEVIATFFANLGLAMYTDDEGRVYPLSNNANSVLDVLRLECARLGVEMVCDFRVAKLGAAADGGFVATSEDGRQVSGESVIVATGGGASLLSSLGHTMVAFEPVLVPLRTETEPIRGLSGVRVRCRASILRSDGQAVATEQGEMLFRDYGVSGIMVFDLSRHLGQGSTLSIDFLPEVPLADLTSQLVARREAFAERTADVFLTGLFHSRVSTALLRAAHIGAKKPVSEISCENLAQTIKNFTLAVRGAGDPKQAQVTRGGAAVEEFDPRTLESKRVAGVFAAGEVLDIDGRCGGYNLHWAWSSGLVAGESAAMRALSRSGASDGRHA